MFDKVEKKILARLDKIDETLIEVLNLARELNEFEKGVNEHFEKIDKSLDELKKRVNKLEKK